MRALFHQVGLFGNLASFRNNYHHRQSEPALARKYFSDVKMIDQPCMIPSIKSR